ncbi:hypothetical protein FKM82_010931 [Ascaphus truei]
MDQEGRSMADSDDDLIWEALCSRDCWTREMAMENLRRKVLRSTDRPEPVMKHQYQHMDPPGPEELNQILARLLMLSKRCPYSDVRLKSLDILSTVQQLFMLDNE